MEPRSDPRLEAAVRAVGAWRGRDIAVTPISVGRDERHVLVEADEELFVLRLVSPSSERPGIDATDEVEVARAAASTGVGPEVVAVLPQLGCLVTRFASGRRLTVADGERDDVLAALAGSIRALHACPPPARERSVFRDARDLRRAVEARGIELPASERPATQAVARIEAAITSEVRALVTSHGDLTTSSAFLDGEHVWIVDFRWAGAGDPYEDLATIATHLELREERADALLTRYFGSVAEVHRMRFALMRTVAGYVAAMRALLAGSMQGRAEERLALVAAGSIGVRPG